MTRALPHICLLVTSRARKDALARLFASLDVQEYKNFHILLGDQNPQGFLEDLLENAKKKLQIEHYFLPPSGLSHARNLLIPRIHGEIVALTDDDCHYPPHCLHQVAEVFSIAPAMDILCGSPCNTPKDNNVRPQMKFSLRKIGQYGIFHACPSWVLFFRESVVKQVGFFDELLGIGCPTQNQSGEETDFVLRAMRQGAQAFRATSIYVWHDALQITPALLQRTRLYGIGRMAIVRNHAMPLWFACANICIPFLSCCIALLCINKQRLRVHWNILLGRFYGFFSTSNNK